MTENETNMSIKHAVCVLEAIGNGLTLSNENDREDACVLAIKSIDELQQYRAIGTVEELQVLNRIAEETAEYVKEDKKILEAYKRIGTIEEFKALKEKSVAKIGLSRGQGHESYLVCPACNSHMKDDQELWDLDGEIIQCKKCKQLVLVDWQ